MTESCEECPACGCEGCQPAQVESGVLCRPDLGRARRALLEAPDLVAWVAENVPPGQAPDDARVTGSREAPAPLNVAALDHVDAVVAVLASWAVTHAAEAGLDLPDLSGARATTSHNHLGCVCGTDAVTGQCVGHLSTAPDGPRSADRITGVKDVSAAPALVARLTYWHLTYLDSIAACPYAVDWHDEVVHTVGRAMRAFPQADRARKVPVPCPECSRLMLHLHPPKGEPEYRPDGSLVSAYDITVICHADDCGKTMGQAEYYLVRRSAMTAAYERAQA